MAVVISRKYEVLALLGQGGRELVYEVRHTVLDAIYALKALPREFMDHPEMLERFSREARVMAQLQHPNIVRVLDIDRDEFTQAQWATVMGNNPSRFKGGLLLPVENVSWSVDFRTDP